MRQSTTDGATLAALLAQIELPTQYALQVTILTTPHQDSQGVSRAVAEPIVGVGTGILGVDDIGRPMISLADVTARLMAKPDLAIHKISEGFTKLIVEPFATPINLLLAHYVAAVRTHHRSGLLFATPQSPEAPNVALSLNDTFPLWSTMNYDSGDRFGSTVYFPVAYTANHRGRSKGELLRSDIHDGWRVLLIEDAPNLPRSAAQSQERGRMPLVAGSSAADYLAMLALPPFHGESGMTPEGHIQYALTHLHETNQVIDDFAGNGTLSYLLGAYFIQWLPFGYVPMAGWLRTAAGTAGAQGWAYFDEREPDRPHPSIGCRTAVAF